MNQSNTENINRRQFVKLVAASTATAAIPITGCQGELLTKKTTTAKRPNIIFLLTDDQRWDTMGCTGNPIIQTPNMDNLAKNGVYFKNAFVDVPSNISQKGR